ncbi:MAG: hypothetical protein EOM23_11770 [Candidatus Moranbacteria bacterium]|nr:hypothetical protein [Candidatus Moranbacteria bacterium]
MKTHIFTYILFVLFLWGGIINAQQTNTESTPIKGLNTKAINNSEKPFIAESSKIVQQRPSDIEKTTKIKVIVSVPGEKIIAINENRETAKKGGRDEE